MISAAHILETALLLLAAYFLGCVLGYVARRILYAVQTRPKVSIAVAPLPEIAVRRLPSPAARLAAAVSDEPLAKVIVIEPFDPRPRALPAPRDGAADNLRQIKGIGPKLEASLHAMGIYHFDQIASWSDANIDWVDGQLAFKGRIRRERWVEQARDLSPVDA